MSTEIENYNSLSLQSHVDFLLFTLILIPAFPDRFRSPRVLIFFFLLTNVLKLNDKINKSKKKITVDRSQIIRSFRMA